MTGGIACGKSLLSRYLNEFGVDTIDADDIVHDLLPVEERRRLAGIVFADPAARRELEARIHPIVRRSIREWFSAREAAGAGRIGVAIIPLLFEVHWEADYDIICCVVSSREKQIERMTVTRGYSREEAEARLAAQMDVSVKAAKSQYVIRNDGSADELRRAAQRMAVWLAQAARH